MTNEPPSSEISHLAPTPLLAGERVAFTGTLSSMTHREAAELVEQHGGNSVQHVTQLTTLLVIGDEGWPLEPDGQPSVKLLAAQALQDRGSPLRLISEPEWLAALGLESRSRNQQLYTPAMLSQLLKVSVSDIRRWERMGLIRPARRVMRLPYFEVGDVSAARKLAQFVANGVSAERLAKSLEKLKSLLPNLEQPLAQLQFFVQGRELLYRDAGGWVEPKTGQRHLPFSETGEQPTVDAAVTTDDDEPGILEFPRRCPEQIEQWTPDDWFERGCRLAEDDRLSEAVEAFRAAIIERPSASEYHFHLADVLYRLGQTHAAIERYYVAVEHDHDFIEAWTQLGCLLIETQNPAAAREAFQIALDRHPEYPDAHFHLAQVLEQLGEAEAALPHWSAYLRYDDCGPWADTARQRLADATELSDS